MKTNYFILIICIFIFSNCGSDGPRNPYGFEDINDPFGTETIDFYNNITIPFSDDNDPNAINWVTGTELPFSSIEGQWSTRWNGGSAGSSWVTGTVEIDFIDTLVFMKHEDNVSTFLTETRFLNDTTLNGRYQNINVGDDGSPIVLIIKNNNRIDGVWERGRWDFRR